LSRATKVRMGRHLHLDEDVARRTAVVARLALSAEPDFFAVVDPSRNLDVDGLNGAISAAHGHLRLAAEYGRSVGDHELVLQVGAPRRVRCRAAAAFATLTEVFEQICEPAAPSSASAAEEIFEIDLCSLGAGVSRGAAPAGP